MHKLLHILFISLTLVISSASAEESLLCSPGCNVTIDFPDGGSIQAIEAMDLIFDINGVIDLGPTGTINTAVQPESLDFSAGGILSLATGESITFDSGGLLSLGEAGNLNTLGFTVDTSGDLIIQGQDGVSTTIFIGNISTTGNLSIIVSSDADILVANDVSGVCTSNATPEEGVTLSSSLATPVSNWAINCDSTSPIFDISGSATFDPTTIDSGGILPLPQEELPTGGFEEVEILITLPDGSNCVITGNQCVADDGTVYQLVDGEWVEVGNSGSFGVLMLLALWMSIGILRRRSSGLGIHKA